MTLRNQNKIGVMALAALLLFAPLSSIMAASARASSLQQDSDVPSDAEQAMFTKGQNLYLSNRFDQAAGVLQDFLKTYPKSIIIDLTLLWLGRSYMKLGKFQEAEDVGQRLRAIKDTPFADIYNDELITARRDNPARNTSASSTTAATGNESRSTASPSRSPETRTTTPPASNSVAIKPPQRQQQSIARATPSPTPRQPLVITNRPANTQSKSAATSTPITRPGTQSAATQNASTASSEQVARVDTLPATTSQQRPRTIDRGRGRRRQPAPAPVINPPATNTATPSTQQTTLNNRQVAINNPPRNNVSARPAMTPTPAPVTVTTTTVRNNISTAQIIPPAPNVETPVESSSSSSGQAQGGLSLTVKQVPNLLLALRRSSETASPGQTVQIPLTVTNTGNKEDQFRLETDLPAEFLPTFSLAQGGSDTGLPILVTPQLARNASVEVLLNLRVPETASDGQQRRFFVRAASQSDYQVLRVADGAISIIAATLSATSNVSQTTVMPGETFTQTIAVRNSGSATAQRSRADFVFNPNFELVSASPSQLIYDRPSRTVIWSLGDLNSRDTRDITVTLRVLPSALSATNALGRGTVRTQSLPVGANFDSPSVTVGKVPAARIDAVSVGLTTTPGDTTYIPFVVRNPGNTADAYELRVTAPGAPSATIYADTNADGQHQDSEPVVAQTSQLDPQGGQFPVLLRVQIPANTQDRQQYSYNMVARSLTSNRIASEASSVLTVATPRVHVRTEQVTDTTAPGDSLFYRLVLINEGSGLAKNLTVTEMLPEALQFVNSDPSLNPQDASGNAQRINWHVPELAPGDTAVLRIGVRLRPNLTAETNLQTRHTLSYQDSNGNSYQGQ
ncbi:MAG TPA: tetratricopeptide repeat protein [Pyrinomonadaceae bacterium]|jgi:uncharacterized repeat protein (TIGR01451 family)|nr:tetratricopeptide repeat protein [Pyrinomonadaceae bacterium]